jgi:catechol 2,3-dioxygenase-like lactoylglutathione lyase family enzyme
VSKPLLKTGHVALNVTDVDRAINFYSALFELDVQARVDGERAFALLGRDGAVVVALWKQSTGVFARDLPGLHHLSFEVPDTDALQAAEQTLKELGVEFAYDGIVAHAEGAASGGLFFYDPDGVRLEIYAPAAVGAGPAPVSGAPTCGFF